MEASSRFCLSFSGESNLTADRKPTLSRASCVGKSYRITLKVDSQLRSCTGAQRNIQATLGTWYQTGRPDVQPWGRVQGADFIQSVMLAPGETCP
eukprot:scaffold140448_cov31-Tisochrysis_lutea.AAC.6